ncbi:non-ribosomal peptide synthetase [Antrihabitans cavernicola]|uniref:Amino acid adenylation domain-containing protein n=1 Tax=Antrihabitans cavernicola TaxID=2495913 RepID=A0A5A7SBE8_9NOCA|nr:amino acid adenylation domain-containing protein [Spelaeibacter cavernicola]KAA0021551.1 amino acid adenylation domain-containing protein [Spelaeibacter cavernicola]
MTTSISPRRHARPATATANTGVVYRLTGPIDATKVREAFAAFLDRRSMRDSELPWAQTSLSDVSEGSRERRLQVLVRREFARPFDARSTAPLRAQLIDTDPATAVLVVVARRDRWDDACWNLLFAEIGEHYNGVRRADRTTILGYLAPPADRLDDADIAHWRTALVPPPGQPALPGERAFRAPGPHRSHRCVQALPPELVDRVRAAARELAVPSSTLLLAAYDSLIYRYTATTDFAVTLLTDARSDSSAIGNFDRSLLLRSTIGPTDSFADVVARTDRFRTAAAAHQHADIDRATAELGIARPARPGGLSFRTRPRVADPEFAGVDATRLPLVESTADLPVNFTVEFDDATNAVVEAECWTGVLEPTALEQLTAAYVHLLTEALTDPTTPVDDLELFGPLTRDALVDASHGVLADTPPNTLIAMIEAQVAATPDHVALGSDDIQITYRELNRRSNQLAHSLIRDGIGTEDVVAIRVAGLADVVTAMLGILKAGAAYLPIDPDYPAHHVDYLLADARPVSVLDELPDLSDLPDTDPTDHDRIRPLRPANLAYVIYSSGSTGIPKGVLVSHEAIAEHMAGLREEFALAADDRLLQTSSIGFDASLLEIFHTLAGGAQLIVPKADAARDYPYIAELIVAQRATVVHMVPSMLRTFLLLSKVNQWLTVRHIPVGGEPLPGEVADRLATVCDAALSNNYGPTEAIVSATRFAIDDAQGARTVPIGKPNRNVYLYVLDRGLRLVPDNAVGEIYLGGNQIARGYANLAGLTAVRFVADPFVTGGLLFRSGDLARRRSDGNIEFVGRADTEVTIDGVRVELGEVESAVATHPAVAQCVVLPTETEEGRILAAYLVGQSGYGPIDLAAVHRHVALLLPEYLAPTAFAVIDEIPVTAHGKLDRLALPTPQVLNR